MVTGTRVREPVEIRVEADDGDQGAPFTRIPDHALAYVAINDFHAAIEQSRRPHLAGKPVAVVGTPDDRAVVVSASPEARSRGVRPGMPLFRAYRACPEGHFLPARQEVYKETHDRFFDVIHEFSDTVEIVGEGAACLRWNLSDWRSSHPTREASVHWPLESADGVRRLIFEALGLQASLGVGSNRLIARIAGEYCRSGGQCHVAPGAERVFMRLLRLEGLPGVTAAVAQVLAASGLTQIADVQRMSGDELACRVGERWKTHLMHLAAGEEPEFVPEGVLPDALFMEKTLPENGGDAAAVREALDRLFSAATSRLRLSGAKAGSVGVRVRTANFRTLWRTKSLGYRSDCHQDLYLAAGDLLAELTRRPESVRSIGVRLFDLEASDRALAG